ncbi:MAG TPA: proline--tRNA ligase, partial [Verrucomicrobia bacterium]|nr:proline--tRNA ligase [Verrucomicrobiota bacterium]
YHVHLIGLNLEDEPVREHAEQLYQKLQSEGIEVLFDDRLLRAGEKFGDADLIGMPCRITLSKRTMAKEKLEFKLRTSPDAEELSMDQVIPRIREVCGL